MIAANFQPLSIGEEIRRDHETLARLAGLLDTRAAQPFC
jgi:hypothetical protein